MNKTRLSINFLISLVVIYCCIWFYFILWIDSKASLNIFSYMSVDYLFVYMISLLIGSCLFAISFLLEKVRADDDYGDANYATNREISKFVNNGLFENKGIILGKKSGHYIRTNEPLSTLIVAPQGTGKTAAIIIPTLLSDTSSMIVNDVKGELWNKTSLQRSRFGDVGIFAPSKNYEMGMSWNPFSKKCLPKDFNTQIDYVDRLANILYPTEQEGMGDTTKHFNSEAKTIFSYFSLYLIIKNGETNIPAINACALETDDVQASIAFALEEDDELREEDDTNPALMPEFLRQLANRILQKEDKEFGSSQTTFTQALEPFCRPNVANSLIDCDFNNLTFRQDRPFTLYIYIPANDVKRMAPIVRMLTEYLINEFLSDSINTKQKVTFVEDEFPRLGRLDTLKEAPALQRSYNIATIFVAQNKEQLESIYGRGSFDHFLTVTDFKAIFTQNEDTTAARFSNLIGKTTRKKRSVSSKDLSLLGSTSENDEGVPFLLPQDIMNLNKNKIVVLVKGQHERPIDANCAWWFKDKYMKSLVGAYNGLDLDKYQPELDEDLTTKPDNDTNKEVTNDICDNEDTPANESTELDETAFSSEFEPNDTDETAFSSEFEPNETDDASILFNFDELNNLGDNENEVEINV